MALTIGSVSVALNGQVTKSGAAGRLYDKMKARVDAKLPGGIPNNAQGTKVKMAIAEQATDLADWLITEIKTFARVQITASTSGLQRMPASTTENTDTKAPSATKELTIL